MQNVYITVIILYLIISIGYALIFYKALMGDKIYIILMCFVLSKEYNLDILKSKNLSAFLQGLYGIEYETINLNN